MKKQHILRIASCLLFFAMVGSAMAQGSDGLFVIKKKAENHYLAHVKVGGTWELQDATTFSPNCLWYSGREFNLAGTKHNYYFIDEDDGSFHFLQASFRSNGSLGLTDDVPETFLLNNSDTLYYFYDWDRDNWQTKDGGGIARGRQYFVDHDHCTHAWEYDECWEVYYAEVKYNDTEDTYYWEMSENESYGITANSGRFRSITTESFNQVVHSETNGITDWSVPSEMVWDADPTVTQQSLSVTIAAGDYSYNYTPAYTTYEFTEVNGTITYPTVIQDEDLIHFKFYYCNGATSTTAPTAINSSDYPSNTCTYLWEITDDPDHFLSFNSESGVYTSDVDSPTLYYRQQNTKGNQSVTLTLTVTYSDGTSQTTQTRTTSVTVKTPCQSPAQAATPALTHDDVTISWYPTATDYNVYWKKASDNWASAASAMGVGNITSYTIIGLEANTAYEYKVCAICGDVEQPAVAEYNFTTKDAPDGMIYGSIFGGGRMADVGGKTEVVIINCDSIGAVYGGNDIFGTVSGADGSTVTLGVEGTHPDAVTYNNGTASEKVRVHDVYGGGNGYYLYSGTSFTGATTPSVSVAGNYTVKAQSSEGDWDIPVWTNESSSSVNKTIPSITKTAITVTNDAVKVDSLFGGAKNAFLTASSGDDVNIAIHGGTINAVFGGNNYGGTLATTERIQVTSTTTETTDYHTKQLGRDFGIGHLFGGGNRVPGQHVVINITGGQCDTVFAGGNAADVLSTQLTLNCAIGTTDNGNLFSDAITGVSSGTVSIDDTYPWDGTGIYNVRALFGGNNKADMVGLPTLNLTSGGVGTVYGGGNQGNMKAQISDGTNGPIATAFGAPMNGTAQLIYYGTHVVMDSPTILVDYLYGGCQMSSVDYSTWVEVKNGHVGHVFGGCNISGDVGSTQRLSGTSSPSEAYQLVKGATYVKASGGVIYENLFAGSNGYYHCNDGVEYIDGVITNTIGNFIGTPIPTHNETHVMVCEDNTVTPNTSPLVKGNVYAGGNMACVGFIGETAGAGQPTFVGYASVRMSGGEVTGNVFGGGNMASIYGSNEVQVSGGTIGGALYGGNDQCGLVAQITNRVLPEGYDLASDGHTSLTALGVHTYVSLTGRPDINTVYGGGNGAYNYTSANYCNPNDKPVQSNAFVDINIDGFPGEGGLQGGHIDTVYGGGNGVTVTGSITVFLNVKGASAGVEPTAYDHVGVIFGGNNMGDLTNLPDIILLHGQVNTIYGGCNKGAMTGSHSITLGGDTYNNISSRVHLRDSYTAHDGTTTTPIPAVVSGAVYGGCCSNIASDIPNNTLVLMEGGNYPTVDLFGGCDVSGNINGTSRVVLKNGIVGNIYGGGDGDYDYTTSTSPYYHLTAPNSAHSQVDMLGGTVGTCIYGGGKLATVSGNSTVNISGGTTEGSVYGAGKGSIDDENAGLVQGNATVHMTNGLVKRSIYGGGELGSVGTFTEWYDTPSGAHVQDEPKTCQSGTGLATVILDGGSVGYLGSKMPTPGSDDDYGWIFCGGRGEVDSITYSKANLLAVVNSTYLEINGGVVTASVYGGSENGLVLDDTHVKITGGQIGTGYRGSDEWDTPYTDAEWDAAKAAVNNGTVGGSYVSPFHECDAWPYEAPYSVHDINAGASGYDAQGGASTGKNGHSFFGNVFGGGSGYYPIEAGIWRKSAGRVWGNTLIEIEGGHILTSIYGGNETTDVMGKSTVNMSGGTLGVPRTAAQIALRPVSCYLFAGGMGDPRPMFDTYNNISETEINLTGGVIFGSIFGGSEDGHVTGNITVNVSETTPSTPTIIGSTGFSGADGNIFGGGRGFTANDVTNGRTEGNITINFSGGKILGNIYGGGRLANTGMKVDGTLWATDLDDHGHITINISGGTIGRNLLKPEVIAAHPLWQYEPENHTDDLTLFVDGFQPEYIDYVGHVFGGGMGLFKTPANPDPSASTNGFTQDEINANVDLLTKFGRVISTEVNIQPGANIYGNVYGGGKLGKVLGGTGLTYFTDVNITGGTVHRRVFGGGRGVMGYDNIEFAQGGDVGIDDTYDVVNSPMVGNTHVRQSGGAVKVGLYGGAETANVIGDSYVNIEGGIVGVERDFATIDAATNFVGFVFGGGKGDPAPGNYNLWTNVQNSHITFTPTNPIRIYGSVFGGGEDGHILSDTDVDIELGSGDIIGTFGYTKKEGNVYGAGRGFNPAAPTAGGTGGNTRVAIKGSGTILGSVYGGGRIASTGVFFSSDNSLVHPLDDNGSELHGHTEVTISGCTIGHDKAVQGSTTYLVGDVGGNVFGGPMGQLEGSNATQTTLIHNMQYVNYSKVTVNGSAIIKGSVYGGGEFGFVRNDAEVHIDGGTIGIDRTDPESELTYSGSVYGGSWGDPRVAYVDLGRIWGNTEVTFTGGLIKNCIYGGGANANVGDASKPSTTGKATVTMSGGTLGWYRTVEEVKARPRIHYLYGGGQGVAGNTTAGSVFSTEVILSGGTVWGSIFGGGQEGPVVNDVEVTFSGGHLGSTGASGADGNIFGGGRGFEGTAVTDGRVGGNITVTVNGNGLMRGSIYGGGRLGSVGMDASGNMQAGTDHGFTTITVNGTVHIEPEDLSVTQGGNIYGACKGLASEPGTTISNMAKVKETHVTVGGATGDNVVISGSVFGGGEDGRVISITTAKTTEGGDTHVFIKDGTTIGISGGINDYNGNVYGGGRGTGTYEDPSTHEQVFSNQSGRVAGNTHVNILGGDVYQYVFGGGNRSVVDGRKIVNIVDGFVHKDVYGGSRFIPQEDGWQQPGLKTVNMLGGKVHNVFGCGQNTIEGSYSIVSGNPVAASDDPTSFVNISGGYLYNDAGDLGSAHAAGMAGTVYGSVVLNIGASAINNAPYNSHNIDKDDAITELPDLYSGLTKAHVPAKLQVSGSVYGGSNFFKMNDFQTNWQKANITGYSNIYIDGEGYDMSAVATTYEAWTSSDPDYMVIDGNFFGCGTHCESGAKGRNITVRHYGARITSNATGQEGWFTGSTRPMGTVQRCNNLVIDNSNFTFTGAPAIDGNTGRMFAVYKVDDCFYVANGSAVTLGSGSVSADMDSIKLLRSVHLESGDLYDETAPSDLTWEWIGVREKSHVANRLFYSSGDETQSGTENMLPFTAENVMIFNREAKLYVRYNNNGNTVYGELNGFFRMIAESYTPWSINSFAYARPKLTVHNEGVATGQPSVNGGDGGFMSYDKKFNFYIMTAQYDGDDGGDPHTRTNQYPYTNVESNSKGYVYRQWIVDNFHGRRWYVAGTGSLGYDSDPNNSTAYNDYGLYPDKPKKSLSGTNGVFAGTWSTNKNGHLDFSFEDNIVTYGANPPTGHVQGEINYDESTFHDVVYVVEPVLASNESGTIQPPVNCEERIHLYRYPGDPVDPSEPTGHIYHTSDPGANYQEMIIVNDDLTLKDVLVDGFYGHVGIDPTYLDIPSSFLVENVEKPLVVTNASKVLTLKCGTILKRGYNKNNADYYSNVDYSVTTTPQGGALFLDNAATLNVEGSVYILDNWQNLTGSADPIRSNVYLPTFAKFLNITSNGLNADARIGITSPQRNAADNYKDNTFSPIAQATDATNAHTAWQQNNFIDDLDIFFGSGTNEQFGDHTTYYSSANVMNGSNQILDNTKLYFGWTWNNIVRTQPSPGYSVIGDDITISNTNGLAWLISVVNGLNGITGGANSLSGKTVTLIDDVDLSQYVWVPVGNEKTGYEKFAGTFDGKGHLINGMSIAYIGVGDGRYMLNNYGLFGKTNGAQIKRTFLVGSSIAPNSKGNLGGLIGVMEGSGSLMEHSEVQVEITTHTDQGNNNACGGLVGILTDGEIRSSMALPTINCPIGYIGGLVGAAKDPNNTLHSGVMLKNSFANVVFNVGANNATVMAGGVLGTNGLADVENCYARNAGDVSTLTPSNFGSVVNFSENGTITHCYGIDRYGNTQFPVYINDPSAKVSNCGSFNATTADKDQLGYMYADNTIADDTALVVRLNTNVMQMNSAVNDSVYAHWARPGLSELNNDYPVLLMDNYSSSKKQGGGEFRSVGTYAGGPALQYGGPARDGNQLNTALGRTKANALADDYLFIYGDVSGETINASITASKVALHEDAAIIDPGTLASFSETYVGVTFDNSSRHAYASEGMNAAIIGTNGPVHLPNDWHMFSSPLSNAPLGFDYLDQNAPVSGNDNFDGVPYNPAGFYNNPWVSTSTEFQWLTDEGKPYYWINNSTNDSYFPSQYGSSLGYTEGQGIPTNAIDHGHYPYSMDLLSWYEPEYHWINFKRNGPNHWHTDSDEDGNHKHLTYYGDLTDYGNSTRANVNETNLVTGKGYMGAITENTFMQSHGYLNTNDKSVGVSALSPWHADQTDNVTGWNLIGNPYHAYLDFNAFASTNGSKLTTNSFESIGDAAFYVVYSADAYNSGSGPESAYLTYPVGGSKGGAYADRYIHPHQGFFVKVKENGDSPSTLSFTEGMTVTRNGMEDDWTSSFRGGNKHQDYTLINLFLSSRNGCSEVTVVEFFRDEWGGARKMKSLRNGNGTFYGYHDGKSYSAIFAKYDADRVPIHFKADEEDVFTLRWTHANGVMTEAYLVDNITGQRYNMADYDSYDFIGRPTDYAARFYIEIKPPVLEEQQDEDNPFIAYYNGSGWVVEGQGQLQLVDLLGQVLYTQQLNGQPTMVHFDRFAAGVYMLRLVRSDRILNVQKIVIE